MSGARLGVVLVGFDPGTQQRTYADLMLKSPLFHVAAASVDAAAADDSRERARRQAGELGVPFVDDLQAAVGRPAVQAVSLCVAFDRRPAAAEQIAALGKHLFVDKPPALDEAGLEAMAAAAARHGVHLSSGFHTRFQESVRAARQAILAGKIGLPWAVSADFVIASGKQASPLGELHNHGMYLLDPVRYLVGAEFTSVYAVQGSFFFDNARQIGVDDLTHIHARMERGIIAHRTVARTPHATHPNGYQGEMTFRISGTAGVLCVDVNRPRLRVHSEKGAVHDIFKTNSTAVMLDEFARALLAGRAPEIGIADARGVLRATLAAYRSARENRVVRL